MVSLFRQTIAPASRRTRLSLYEHAALDAVDVGKNVLADARSSFKTNYGENLIKSWLDNTTLSLSEYKMDAVVGGEGMSESLRSFMLKSFKTVVSSYGASDLEINIGVETELTIALRHLCFENRELCETIFGSETPPMIFNTTRLII